MKRGHVYARAPPIQYRGRDLEILQLNTDRKKITHDLLQNIVKRDRIDICVTSEPNINITKKLKYLADKRCDAAIVVANQIITIKRHGRGEGYVWAELDSVILYSCYISPNNTMTDFKRFLRNLGQEMRGQQKPAIVAGDFNAKSAAWGSPKEYRRGDVLAEWLQERNMIVLNSGNKPTFISGEQESHIDITTCTEKLTPYVSEWRVSDEETLGYHQMLRYKITAALKNAKTQRKQLGDGGTRRREQKSSKETWRSAWLCRKKKGATSTFGA